MVDHPEVNAFVDRIYKEHIHQLEEHPDKEKAPEGRVARPLCRVVEFNLNIVVHMSMNAYSDGTVSGKGKSRYNALNIKVMIDIVHRLLSVA